MIDPCEFLTPAPAGPDSRLRQRLFDQTLATLRRRWWLRRTAWAAGLAASVAAGVFALHVLHPPAPTPPPRMADVNPPTVPEAPRAVPDVPADGAAPRPEQLVKAADHFLAEADPLTALHGYGQALDKAGPEALAVSPDDSFLLIAIKDARLKEKRDAKTAN